jgi:hypothetical protein
MKKFFTIITLLTMFLVVGCVDLDEVWNEIDFLKKQNAEQANELEERKAKISEYEAWLAGLKQLTNDANSEIGSIKGLVDALSNKVSVVSYRELTDKSGYELTMSDGSKIILKNGKDGADGKDGKDGADGKDGKDGVVPDISVKLHDDGLLYWTINGEFLLDADGNMIPAQGKDGKEGKDGKDGADGTPGADGKDGKDGADGASGPDGVDGKNGITPILRVNRSLLWEMSLDGGKTWQLVRDSKNHLVNAQGPRGSQGPAGQPGAVGEQGPVGPKGDKGETGNDGDLQLSITETDYAFIIFYKGVTYIINKEKIGPANPPINPLSLVTKYNVNTSGDGFVTDSVYCTGSGYFNFDDAVATFTNITIDSTAYHLPSEAEWLAIIPKAISSSEHYVEFINDATNTYNNVEETVTVQGTSITMTSDYRTGIITYALRYKGTNMQSAWKYEYVSAGGETHVKITSRNMKDLAAMTVDDIKQSDFWQYNNANDVIRYFPAGGFSTDGGVTAEQRYIGGFFWSSMPSSESETASCMTYITQYMNGGEQRSKSQANNVRLFYNN